MPGTLDPLYLITDRTVPPSGDLLGALEAALRGGVRLLQFREKDLSSRTRYELGGEVMRLASAHGAAVIVNGDPALAQALGADGVHLGKETLPVGVVRERLGYGGLIGYSAHGGREAEAAFAAGADFVTLSPVFPTRSKAARGAPLGLGEFGAQARGLPGPVYALGGVEAANAADCLRAGAHGVALIGAILGAEDPAAAAAALREALGAPAPPA